MPALLFTTLAPVNSTVPPLKLSTPPDAPPSQPVSRRPGRETSPVKPISAPAVAETVAVTPAAAAAKVVGVE